jgi:hypothetical protein
LRLCLFDLQAQPECYECQQGGKYGIADSSHVSSSWARERGSPVPLPVARVHLLSQYTERGGGREVRLTIRLTVRLDIGHPNGQQAVLLLLHIKPLPQYPLLLSPMGQNPMTHSILTTDFSLTPRETRELCTIQTSSHSLNPGPTFPFPLRTT